LEDKLLTASQQEAKLLLVAINMTMVFTITVFPRNPVLLDVISQGR
jgi:hypothetical protein